MYSVKEIYYTFQGEGAYSGRPSIFCRFSGCNLWSGKEKDRKKAKCNFCDTDFVGTDGTNGGKFFSEKELGKKIISLWKNQKNKNKPYVVFTGGEPLLQLDKKLINFLKLSNFEIGIETNGTIDFINGTKTYLNNSIHNHKPKTGDMIIFPNNLMHTAYPFNVDGERRSFSFNLDLDVKTKKILNG